MSIDLQSLEVRSETRIRLLFTNTLASGAFGSPAPAFYEVTNEDGRGTDCDVQAALVVPGSATVVELVLSPAIVRGAVYTVRADGVPATDLSSTPVDSTTGLRWGISAPKENVEPGLRDRQRLLYGIDLIWTGSDFQETALGDLDRVSGPANVTKALNRGVESGPLPWDNDYGAGARDFVDSPSLVSGTLKGSVASQILRDPRVKSSKVTHEIDDEKTYIYADPILISGEPAERVSIEVPNDS